MGTPDFNQTATKMKNFNQAIEAALADNTVIAVADALRDTKVTVESILGFSADVNKTVLNLTDLANNFNISGSFFIQLCSLFSTDSRVGARCSKRCHFD